ncbi:hypothetical protein IMZ48_41530 [Candidatus Bathyarchaeota archaeon]|nr:hypothetical protein [Candidatus Bathyarchaeota archaeon]
MPRAFPPSRAATTIPSRSTGAGRKRTRDEAEPDLSDADDSTPSVSAASTPDNVWMSGNDMAMFETEVAAFPFQTEVLSAAEAMRKTEMKTNMQMQHDQQLSGRSHKTQRRGQMAPVAASSPDTGSPNPDASGHSNPAHVVVDDFTLQLGIGWKRISNDDHIQAAARGWARFIENHYPITNAVIRLESKGLQSYLIEASEGYFLFDENLRHGRLVSTTGEGALQNLKSHPPAFEGPETMMAATQPKIAPYSSSARMFGTLDMEMEVC